MLTTHSIWQWMASVGLLCLLALFACESQNDPQCTTSSDCAGETVVCRESSGSRICLPIKADMSCPKSCVIDKDCALPLCAKATRCIQGQCSSAGTQPDAGSSPPDTSQPESSTIQTDTTPTTGSKSIGDKCDLGVVGDCGAGMLCTSFGDQVAVCTIECSDDESVCVSHPTHKSCLPLGPMDGAKVCVAFLPKGADCSPIFTVCARDFPPLYCDDKTKKCIPAVLSQAGEACNPTGDNTQPMRVCDYTKRLQCNKTTKVCE